MNEIVTILKTYESYMDKNILTLDDISTCVMALETALSEKEVDTALIFSKKLKKAINKHIEVNTDGLFKDVFSLEKYAQSQKKIYEIIDYYYDVLKIESFHVFESYIIFMEKNRKYEKRFYLPRRKTLKIVVDDLQDLEDGKFKFYGLSMPARTGKSTICIFFLSWIALKRPNSHSTMGGHSGILAKGFQSELLTFMNTPEYTFKELYEYHHPGHVLIRDKSADELTITLDEPDRFATITCRGIDGTWTGAIDVSSDGYLYIDDLVRDRQHSLSPRRMADTWQEYLNKMVDRKNDGSRELMVGTLWNVMDPLEKMRKLYENNPEYRFRKIPALNDKDESNFDYEINGFSTKYYHDMRKRLDNAEWMAKFMQAPYVREGILFNEEELRYFNGILPDGDCRRVCAVDVAWGGGDSLSMPIGVEYENGDVYIIDWVFSKFAKEITIPIVVGKLMQNEIRQVRFESDTGGDLYCGYVSEKLSKNNYKCSCTSKRAPNRIEKKSKIIAYSGDVKRKFIFLQPNTITAEDRENDIANGIIRYERSKEYQEAMDEFTTYVTIGDNDHDDAVDGIVQLEMFLENPSGVAKAEAMDNPFNSNRYGGFYGY